jgi:hypothetical protein
VPFVFQSRGEERDREDAISFASRKSLNSSRRQQRQPNHPGMTPGFRSNAASGGGGGGRNHPNSASMRSKRSVLTPAASKKYPVVMK